MYRCFDLKPFLLNRAFPPDFLNYLDWGKGFFYLEVLIFAPIKTLRAMKVFAKGVAGTLALGMSASVLMAQNSLHQSWELVPMKAVDIRKEWKKEALDHYPWGNIPLASEQGNSRAQFSIPGVISFTVIGNTYYGWQTHASTQPRMVDDANGFSTVWTFSPDAASGMPDRGTGYNHGMPSTGWGPAPTQRIENVRTGWPSLGRLESGGNVYEYVIAHGLNGEMILSERQLPNGNWTSSQLIPDSCYYPQLAISGNYLYLLTMPNGKIVNGVEEPYLIGRFSMPSGNVVDSLRMLPMYDSYFSWGGLDLANIVARDSIVAVAFAGHGLVDGHLVVWKSTDWGATFTPYVVDRRPASPTVSKSDGNYPDTAEYWSNDGSVDVTIDENGKVHVAWGAVTIGAVYYDTDSMELINYWYPSDPSIGYWNEDMGEDDSTGEADPFVVLNGLYDRYGDGVINIRSSNLSNQGTGTGRYWYTSLGTHPSIVAVDGGEIIILYDIPYDSAFSLNGPNLRDIWAFYYDGNAWDTTVKNLTEDTVKECVFPYAPPYVSGDTLRFWYMRDDFPGTAIGSNPQHSSVNNEIVAVSVAIDKIADGTIKPEGNNYYGGGGGTGFADVNMVESRVFPNPVDDVLWVAMADEMEGRREVTITNALGQVVYQTVVFEGQAMIDMSDLPAGLYSVRVTDGRYVSVNQVMKR